MSENGFAEPGPYMRLYNRIIQHFDHPACDSDCQSNAHGRELLKLLDEHARAAYDAGLAAGHDSKVSVELSVIARDFTEWHRGHSKYGAATIERVGLNLGEEAGEAQRAIDRIIWNDDDGLRSERLSHLESELYDTISVAVVLLVRFVYVVPGDIAPRLRRHIDEIMKRSF